MIPSTKKKNPLLTVIVPFTQVENFLGFFKDWIENIHIEATEILLVYDRAHNDLDDSILHFFQTYRKYDLKVIEGQFGSPGMARNAALKFVRGEWLMFWDSDDLPNPQIVIDCLRNVDQQIDICVGDYEIYSVVNRRISCKNTLGVFDVAMNPGIWRIAFRKKLVDNQKFCSSLMGEDQLFLAEIHLARRKIKFFHKIFYRYNQGAPSQLTSRNQNISELIAIIIRLGNLLSSSSGIEYRFLSIMINRMVLTGLKKVVE